MWLPLTLTNLEAKHRKAANSVNCNEKELYIL